MEPAKARDGLRVAASHNNLGVKMLPYNLSDVRRAPAMFFPRSTYDEAVAFVMGIDETTHHSFLLGFKEWLAIKASTHEEFHWNYHWSGVLPILVFPSSPKWREMPELNAHTVLIDFLFQQLEEFLDARKQPDGMRTIYLRYQECLEDQDWYFPGSPHWIEHRVGSKASKN